MAVPKLGRSTPHWTGSSFSQYSYVLRASCIRKIFIDGLNTFIPHPAAILIVEQNRALQKIFVVTIDRSADMAVGVGPLSRLDVDPRSHQTNGRAAIVNFNQRALCFVIEDLPVSESRQRAELN